MEATDRGEITRNARSPAVWVLSLRRECVTALLLGTEVKNALDPLSDPGDVECHHVYHQHLVSRSQSTYYLHDK